MMPADQVVDSVIAGRGESPSRDICVAPLCLATFALRSEKNLSCIKWTGGDFTDLLKYRVIPLRQSPIFVCPNDYR